MNSLSAIYKKVPRPVANTFLFIIITLIVHFLFRYWSAVHNFYIGSFQVLTPEFADKMATIVYRQSAVVVQWLVPAEMKDNMFIFPNTYAILVNGSCSGLKQFIQFALLMILFPGPWKHKLWFIPTGILILHLTNLFRIITLAVFMCKWPGYWEFVHWYPMRIIFYVVIFGLWVFWNEKIRHKGLKSYIKTKS